MYGYMLYLSVLTCVLHVFLLVAPVEAANTVDAPVVDDPPSARFTWTVENFSRLTNKKLYSDVFVVGGYKWYILSFVYLFVWKGVVISHEDVCSHGVLCNQASAYIPERKQRGSFVNVS